MDRHASVLPRLFALFLTALFCLSQILLGASPLDEELQQLKQAGIPTTIEELNLPEIPDSENGALVYGRAFQVLQELKNKHREEWRYLPYEGEVKWSDVLPADKERIRNLLLDNPEFTEFYRLLEKASEMRCRFLTRDQYAEGLSIKLPFLASLRQCSRLLAARADILAGDGRIDEALGDCLTCLKISGSLSEEPILIEGLVRLSLDNLALTRIEAITKKGSAGAGICRVLMKEMERERNDRVVQKGLQGELVLCGLMEFSVLKEQAGKADIGPLVDSLGMEGKEKDAAIESIRKDPTGFFEKNELVYLKIMGEWIALSQEPYFKAKEKMPAFEKELSRLPDESAALVKILMPAYSGVFLQEARTDARLGNAEIALACLLYRAGRYGYPASLKDLSPEFLPALPLDPFTGKDYIYRTQTSGFTIYSVGEDGAWEGDGRVSGVFGQAGSDRTYGR